MKDGFIKVGANAPEIAVAAVRDNTGAAVTAAREAALSGVKILVFPELTLTGATAGDLFLQRRLISLCESALSEYIEATEELELLSFIGLPTLVDGRLYDSVAAIYRGELLAVIPKSYPTREESRWFAEAPLGISEIVFAGRETLFGTDIIFGTESMPELSVAVAVGSDISNIYSPARRHAAAGANIIVNPSYAAEAVTRGEVLRDFIKSESRVLSAAIIVSEAGEGESGTDGIYSGRALVAECGKLLCEKNAFDGGTLTAVCDVERCALESVRTGSSADADTASYEYVGFELPLSECETPKLGKSPFIPECDSEFLHRAEEILTIQSRSLANRIKRSYSKGAVLGLSGGLDSTLALLVTVRAMDILGLDRKNILSVTMPCFGTTERTRSNAELLAEALGTSLAVIDIKAAVNQHFSDIGHSADDYSVVYENAQARERTQVLMDMANQRGALVVGTGDLSELALGFATYNGDHMSMYGVNADIPKTLMRRLVSYVADKLEKEGADRAAGVLRDILATPVSPELLPPKDGEIAQCTEGIVGPYELHDFFLYYSVRRGYSPSKVRRLAERAFRDEYAPEVILGWLKMFYSRFFSQQFKRSCLPDGPRVGSLSLSPRGGLIMPSDSSSADWLSDLE